MKDVRKLASARGLFPVAPKTGAEYRRYAGVIPIRIKIADTESEKGGMRQAIILQHNTRLNVCKEP